MTERIQKILALVRKAELVKVLRGAKAVPVEDEANPDLDLGDEARELRIDDEDTSELPVNGLVDPKEERLQLIRERGEALQNKKNKDYKKQLNQERDNFKGQEVEYNVDMAVAKYRKLQKELGMRGYDKEIVKSEMQELLNKFPQLPELIKSIEAQDAEFGANEIEGEEEFPTSAPEVNGLDINGTEPQLSDEEKVALEANYKSKAEAIKAIEKRMAPVESEISKLDNEIKNQGSTPEREDRLEMLETQLSALKEEKAPLQQEIMEIIKQRGGRRGYEFVEEQLGSQRFGMNDVLEMANDMYTLDEAQKALRNMPQEDLVAQIKEKIKALGLDSKKDSTEEALEEVEAYFFGKTTTAQEVAEKKRGRPTLTYEDIKGLPFNEVPEEWMDKKLSTDQKLEMADYVELYALDKYLTKLLNQRKKNGLKEVAPDEPVDIESLEKSIGHKPKPQHGDIKRIDPETGAVTYIPVAEWEKMVKERQLKKKEEKERARASIQLSIREANYFDEQVEGLVCTVCHKKNNECSCPGGPAMAVNKQASVQLSIREAKEKVSKDEETCEVCHKREDKCICA